MKLLSLVFILLLPSLGIGLSGQGPPSNFNHVGMPLRQQTAHQASPTPVDGSQVFGLFADPNYTLRDEGLGRRIRLGAGLWMFAAGCSRLPGSKYIQMTGAGIQGTTFHFFSLSLMTNATTMIPLGIPGHNDVFSEPAFLVPPTIVFETFESVLQQEDPVWTMTQDMENVVVVEPWFANFRLVKIPNNPALNGTLFSAQSYRLNSPSQPWIHCSDEIIFVVG